MLPRILRQPRLAAACLLAFAPFVVSALPSGRPITIHFQGVVGTRPFACSASYDGIGTNKRTMVISDFAMYISNVRLVTKAGAEVPLQLDADAPWQHGDVALLDFEDGTGPCVNGTKETRTVVTGSAPDGEYVGVRFDIGVPFARNHGDLALEPSPLNLTRMMWAWNSGHKFLRVDAKTSTGKAWIMHLGSTGCTPSTSAVAPPTACQQGNRVPVEVLGLDLAHDALAADIATLFGGNGDEADGNQVCMSSPRSAPCAPMFKVLGLPFNASPAGPQSFIRIVRGAAGGAQ